MSPKKHKLNLPNEMDFVLLGLMSDDPGYRLCWHINRETGTDFRREDDLRLFHKKLNSEQSIALFSHFDPHAQLHFRIIQNACDPGFFLDEMKNLDYLIHIQGEISEEQVATLIREMQALAPVRMCVRIDPGRLKSGERLQLW